MKTLAIIPARGGSKRLPGKNTKSFLGVPLIAWSIRFALRQERFDKVIVSTDSDEIAGASRAEGVDVPYLRPAALASDTATSAAVVLDILDRERQSGNIFDLVALLQPTSPVRDPSRWNEAFAHIDGGVGDAAIGVALAHPHPNLAFHWGESGKLRPFAQGMDIALRSQDFPPVVYVAGNMYLIRSNVLESEGGFFPPRTVGVLCDHPCEAVDIDTEADWVAAEALAKHYGRSP